MGEINYTLLINTLIQALAIIVARFLIPWLKAELGAIKFNKLVDTIGILVKSAEQLDKIHGNLAEEKLDYVKSRLEERGIEITQEVIDIIESAVFDIEETNVKVQSIKLQQRDNLYS